MELPSIWLERLAEWRASKLSAEAFCGDKDYSVHSLRTWRGKQLEVERRTPAAKESTKLARVQVAAPSLRWAAGTGAASGVAVEVGVLRVSLARGFDPTTLAAVLGVIAPEPGA